MSRNPYHDGDDEPKLRRSVFVFMDILGYREMIRQSERDGTEQEIHRALHRALASARKVLEDDDIHPALKNFAQKDFFALKAFTDNIVIGWPIHFDGESEFGSAFSRLAMFQFEMAMNGYFIRGGLSVRPAYIDEISVFGSALTEAHDAESSLARDPRIVLTTSAVEVAQKHLTYYSTPSHAPHARDILKDSDGQWFLNYLECVLIAEDERGPFYGELLRHKRAVEEKLAAFKAYPHIWSKYAWVASYHNYFCGLNKHYFNAEHQIDVDLFRAGPSLIFE
jgi:hypothetical protein